MALKYSFSNAFSYYYVQNDTYDAAGRVDVRSMGANNLAENPVLKTDYDYYPWSTQGGRLRTLKTGTPTNPISLQSFEYNYDAVGNINWINDYIAGGTQTQTFTYDSLNRLTSVSTSQN
jgi:YD repeat-containing protein